MTTPETAHCACGRPAKHFNRTVCHACYERERRRNPRGKPTIEARFFRFVADPAGADDCWIWTGNTSLGKKQGGYGVFSPGGGRRPVQSHRWIYEFLRAEIPTGLVIDHLCRQPPCVNPWHMEPVTIAVNSLRGEAPAIATWREGVCRRGHSMEDALVVLTGRQKGRKNCRTCVHQRWAEKAADPDFRARRAAYERDRKARKGAAA